MMRSGKMIYVDYDFYVSMQLRIKNQERLLASFRSGDEYRRLEKGTQRIRHYYERRLRLLEQKIESQERLVHSHTQMWFHVFEDVQAEQEKRIKELEKEIEKKTRNCLRRIKKLQS